MLATSYPEGICLTYSFYVDVSSLQGKKLPLRVLCKVVDMIPTELYRDGVGVSY
jgi:hypothetical protein